MTSEVQESARRSCPLCGGEHLRRVVRFKTGQTVYYCGNCRNGHIWPLPKFTPSDYAAGHANNAGIFAGEETLRRGYARHFCSFIRQGNALTGRRVLEIGCGAGYLLDEMALHGAKVEGIEIDPDTGCIGRNRGLTVHDTDIASWARDHEGACDLVVMCHVLEHLPDAVACLGQCRRMLVPGGAICLAQPLHAALVPKVMGRRWQAWAPEQHYWHFTPDGLTWLLKKEGFVVDDILLFHLDYHWPSIKAVTRPKYFIACLVQALAGVASFLVASRDQFYLSARRK